MTQNEARTKKPLNFCVMGMRGALARVKVCQLQTDSNILIRLLIVLNTSEF
jgi:hypothetical protein